MPARIDQRLGPPCATLTVKAPNAHDTHAHSEGNAMTDTSEQMHATTHIDAAPAEVFAFLRSGESPAHRAHRLGA